MKKFLKNDYSKFKDDNLISNSLKFNRFIILIVIILAILNIVINYISFFNEFGLDHILKYYTYNPLFYILIIIPLITVNLNYSHFSKVSIFKIKEKKLLKYKYINILCVFAVIFYLIMVLISAFSSAEVLKGWTEIYPNANLFLIIFILFGIALILTIIKKHVELIQLIGIITFLIGFIGFLYYSHLNYPFTELSLNYLIFIVCISYLFITTFPEEGISQLFYLKTIGSKSTRNIMLLITIVLAIIYTGIMSLNDSTNINLNEGALISGFSLAAIFILIIYSVYLINNSEIKQKSIYDQSQEDKLFFEDLIKNMDEAVLVTDKNNDVIYVNNYFLEYLDKKDNILGKNCFDLDIPFLENLENDIKDSIEKEDSVFIEAKKVEKANETIYLSGWCTPKFENNEYNGSIFTLIDITSEKEKESILRHSINEKNLILTEVHHRVKNNMQIINSLLNLQSYTVADQSTKDIIKESQNRILAMALIHEHLYKNVDFSTIDAESYLNSLILQIKNSYLNSENIKINTDIISKSFNIDELVPIGLIVNELLTNSIKYAFPDNNGTIWISLSEENNGKYTLSVKDNGVGLGKSKKHSGIGTDLINSLIIQINGSYELIENDGLTVNINFEYND